MTKYTVLPDGTRVYASNPSVKYRPVPLEKRKYKVRKPPSKTAVRWRNLWLEPLVFVPEEARSWPVMTPFWDGLRKPRSDT